jgi:hypothetical protein
VAAGGAAPAPATAGNPQHPAAQTLNANPLFRDASQNPLFRNITPPPAPSQSQSRPQESRQPESKPPAHEPSHSSQPSSSSHGKLNVVLPGSLRPQLAALDLTRRLDESLGMYDRLVFQAIVRLQDIRSRQAELSLVAQQLRARYAELAADPEVNAALEALNKTGRTSRS